MQRILTLVLLSLLVVACGHKKDAQTFEGALEASTGQNHSVVKLYTETGEYVVYKNEVTGEFSAYNMAKWDRENMSTMSQYMTVAVNGTDIVKNLLQHSEYVNSGYYEPQYSTHYESYEYYDYNCDCYLYENRSYEVYMGERWVDTSHWYTFYTGGGFRFDNTSSQSKDLDTIAALKEEVAEKFMAHKLKSEFSLSASRAEELAKLAGRYQKLENARELTQVEKDKFAMDALGVSMNQVEAALKQKAEGNESNFTELMNTAAQVNNTTPEQIGKFFNEMVIDEL
ncbi:MAG TPA: hypothetical protein VNJ08_13190 [Bacteriovoracaceae bacterium]|nr:hypothetical protein [Bacteriovoracaceae bacterium]